MLFCLSQFCFVDFFLPLFLSLLHFRFLTHNHSFVFHTFLPHFLSFSSPLFTFSSKWHFPHISLLFFPFSPLLCIFLVIIFFTSFLPSYTHSTSTLSTSLSPSSTYTHSLPPSSPALPHAHTSLRHAQIAGGYTLPSRRPSHLLAR